MIRRFMLPPAPAGRDFFLPALPSSLFELRRAKSGAWPKIGVDFEAILHIFT